MGKARTFSDPAKDAVYQKEYDDEIYSASVQQNSYNLGSTHFSDQSGIGNFTQAGSDQRKANLKGALFTGNIGFDLQTAILDVPSNTIDLLEDNASAAIPLVSTDRIVSLSAGVTADLITITGAQKPGQRLYLYGIFGNTITIKHTAAATDNTILTPDELDFDFSDNMVVELVYDISTAKWRIAGSPAGGGGIADGTLENQHLEWDDTAKEWKAVEDISMFVGTAARSINNAEVVTFISDLAAARGQIGRSDFFGTSQGLTQNIQANDNWVVSVDTIEKIKLDDTNDQLIIDEEIQMLTNNIIGGGAGVGLTNIGELKFVDNLATPIGIAIYSDGTDIFPTVPLNMNGIDILTINNLRGDVDGTNQFINSFGTTTGIAGDESWETHIGQDGHFQVADSTGIKFRVGGFLNPLVESIDLTVTGDVNISTGGLLMNNGDITMGTGEIIAGGAAKEINNIGELVFVNNTLSPAGNGIFFFDGTDLKAKTGGTTVNLTDIGGSNFTDAVFRITDELDLTKKMAFDVGTNIPTLTTRTYTMPNADGTLFLASAIQDLVMNSNSITAGGAGEGMTNIGSLKFVDNLATPTGIALYSDGADIFTTADFDINGFDIKMGNGQISEVEVVGFFDVGGQINVSGGAAGFNFVTTGNVPFRFTPFSTNVLDIDSGGLTFIGTKVLDMAGNTVDNVGLIEFAEAGQQITDNVNGMRFILPDAADTFDFTINANTTLSIEKFFFNLSNTRIQMNDEIDPASPVAGDIYVYAKQDAGFAKLFYKQSDGTVVGPLGVGGGGSQTPWTSNIDGDGFNLQDVGAIEFRGEADPADTFAFINEDVSNVLRLHAVVGGTMRFRIGSTDEILINNTSFRPVSDEGMELGTAGARFLDVNTVGVTFKNNGTKVPAANIHEIVGQTAGLFFGVDDLTDEFRFYFAGQEHMTILEDGEIQFPQDGHRIVPTSTSLNLIASLSSDDVEIWNGTSSSNESVNIENFRTTFRTSTTDTQAYILQIVQNNNTPADFRTIGNIDFIAENSSSVDTIYGRISASSQDITNATEDGLLQLGIVSAGTLISGIDIEGGTSASTGAKIGFFGTTPVVQQVVAGGASVATVITALKNLGLFT